MSAKGDGMVSLSAFPVMVGALSAGLSKREYFAAQALHGYLAVGVPRVAAVQSAVATADSLIDELNGVKP